MNNLLLFLHLVSFANPSKVLVVRGFGFVKQVKNNFSLKQRRKEVSVLHLASFLILFGLNLELSYT